MKEIRITLEDKEYKQVLKVKGGKTWKQHLMRGVGEDGSNNNIKK